jgi:PAS domain S-box-containing protein
MVITSLAILLVLHYHSTVADKRKRQQARYVVVGISVPIIAGIITEVLLPAQRITIPELTNASSSWLAILIGYAMWKYELFVLSPETAADQIISAMGDSLVLLNPDGTMVSANKATLDLLGYEERELIGQPAEKIFGKELREGRVLEEVLEKGLVSNYEMTFHPKEGKAIPVFFSCSAIKNKEGANVGIVAISRDITQRKEAEERVLRQSAQLDGINKVLREALRYETDEGVAKVCLDVSQELTGSKMGFIGEVNRAGRFDTIALSDPGWEACRMPKSEAAVMIRDMEIRGLWGKVLKEGQSLIANDPSSHPDRVGIPPGHSPLTSFLGVPLKQAGRTIGMIALANKESGYDMGDQQVMETLSVSFVEALSRKRAEEELRESEERFRAVVEQSVDAIFIVDAETKCLVEANAGFQQLLGYPPEETIRLPIYAFIEADRADIDRTFQNILRGQGPVFYERRYRRKDGSFVDIGGSSTPISFGGRKAVCTIVRDLTERKRAEEALRQSEKRYRAVVEQSPDGIFLDDVETRRILEANEAFQKLLGYSADEIQRLTIYDIIAADREDIDKRFEKILGAERPFTHERQYRRKDGSLVDVSISAKAISYGGRRTTCVLVRDITERKRAEEALRESEERYRAVMEQSADGIYLVDVETKCLLEANPAFAHMLGYGPEETEGLSIYDIVAADRGDIDQRFQDVLKMEGSLASERKYRRKDGSLLEVWVSVNVLSYRGRKAMCTIAHDITERKRAEEALRKSEERYRTVTEQSPDGIYLVDVETRRILDSNSAFRNLLGYDPDEVGRLALYDFIAAEREDIDRRFEVIIRSEGPLSFERQFRRKDGSLVDVWIITQVVSYGERNASLGLVRDISERKRATEEREKLIAELREALDNIKTLRGLVPICANCKKIRDDKGYWQQVEVYVRDHSEATFTHGLCPECAKLLFPDYKKK